MKRFPYMRNTSFQADMNMSASKFAFSFSNTDDFLLILGAVFAAPFFVAIGLWADAIGILRLRAAYGPC